ncbi:MAG: CHAD domain-containing protein [Gemmatimonadales bacterium]
MSDQPITSATQRLPAQEVAREVARLHLRRAVKRARALRARRHPADLLDPALSELIHDFRVALRRLRSWLRACRVAMADTVPGGRWRDLRAVSRRAGRVRDFEVELAWLRGVIRDDPGAAPAAHWLVDRDRDRHGRALLGLLDHLGGEWRHLANALDEEFRHYYVEVCLGETVAPPVMGTVLAAALRSHRDEFLTTMTPPPKVSQVAELHRTRIAAKHLRYLLEVFDARTRSRSVALAALRKLQDDVGELHDAQTLDATLADLERSKRRPGAPDRAAFEALQRAVRRRIRAAWSVARPTMAEARRPAVTAEIDAMARRCELAAAIREPGKR